MNKDTRIASRLTEEDKAALDKYCEENDISISQAVRRAIREMISKNEIKNQN